MDSPRDTARAAFRETLASTADFHALHRLFELNPQLFDFWDRTANWLELRPRIEALAGDGPNAVDAAMLLGRLHLALRDYDGFLALFDRLPPMPGHPVYTPLFQTAAFLRAKRFPDFSRPKIFCLGLSKTGTTSLTAALIQLGLFAMHFINPLTCEVLRPEDAWFCDAMADTPVCLNFETLYHQFPAAKFIYTTRALEPWARSFSTHYQRNYQATGFDDGFRTLLFTRGGAHRGQERAAIYAGTIGHQETAAEAYRAFDRRVKSFFAANDASRLLEIDIAAGDGWAQLCPFLGRPVPQAAFPWRNKTALPD